MVLPTFGTIVSRQIISRGRGEVPREAHNLQTPVRFRAPQQVKENTSSRLVFSFTTLCGARNRTEKGVGETGFPVEEGSERSMSERRKTVGFRGVR